MTEISPCPFCGGEANAYFDPGTKGAFGHARVECRQCGAVPYVHMVYRGLSRDEAVQGVIEAWNRRAEK